MTCLYSLLSLSLNGFEQGEAHTTAGSAPQAHQVEGQVRGVGKGDITDQVVFIASLFGGAA